MTPKRDTKGTLKQQIYKSVKQDILSGTLRPGEMIVEPLLAKRFNASRTPVREALGLLQREGLVRQFPYRGCIVRELTMGDVLDIFELRFLLESYAVRKLVNHIQPADIDQLQHVQDRALRGEVEPAEANREFHLLIAQKAGNELLVEFLEQLHDKMQRIVHEYLTFLTAEELLAPHSRIVAALRSRDPDAASISMQDHLRRFQDLLLRRL